MRKTLILLASFFCITGTMSSGLVHGQVYRTFVSGTGSDTNACSILAPCRTFSRAMNVVTSGGEVVVLDSAGYGPVNIGKSVSITAPDGIYAGITTSADGVYIFAPLGRIYLRGLTIVAATPGTSTGINFVDGASLIVEKCRIRGFANGMWAFGQPGTLVVKDTVFSDNTIGIGGDLQLQAAIANCTIEGSTDGIQSLIANFSISDSIIMRNSIGIRCIGPWSQAQVIGCKVMSNSTAGVSAENSAVIRMADTVVTANGVGLVHDAAPPNGSILSRNPASNTVVSNITANGAFTGTYDPF